MYKAESIYNFNKPNQTYGRLGSFTVVRPQL